MRCLSILFFLGLYTRLGLGSSTSKWKSETTAAGTSHTSPCGPCSININDATISVWSLSFVIQTVTATFTSTVTTTIITRYANGTIATGGLRLIKRLVTKDGGGNFVTTIKGTPVTYPTPYVDYGAEYTPDGVFAVTGGDGEVECTTESGEGTPFPSTPAFAFASVTPTAVGANGEVAFSMPQDFVALFTDIPVFQTCTGGVIEGIRGKIIAVSTNNISLIVTTLVTATALFDVPTGRGGGAAATTTTANTPANPNSPANPNAPANPNPSVNPNPPPNPSLNPLSPNPPVGAAPGPSPNPPNHNPTRGNSPGSRASSNPEPNPASPAGSPPESPAQPNTPAAPTPVTFGQSQVLTSLVVTSVVIGGTTIVPGAPATTIGGIPLSIPSTGSPVLVVDTSTIPITALPSAIGSQSVSLATITQLVAHSTIVLPGAPAATIGGTPASGGTAVVIGSSIIPLGSASTGPEVTTEILVGSQILVSSSLVVTIAGTVVTVTTNAAGSPEVVIGGSSTVPVSFLSSSFGGEPVYVTTLIGTATLVIIGPSGAGGVVSTTGIQPYTGKGNKWPRLEWGLMIGLSIGVMAVACGI